MILFVFEGEDREPYLYKTLEKLYLPKDNDNIICSFGNNIYDLYSEMEANYVVTGNNEMPKGKDVINQTVIFDAQKTNYVDKTKSVAILNSFPLFLYEYLK